MTTTTIATYVGNGSQTDFQFSFDYLRKEFVKVLVEGVETAYTFHTAQTVKIVPAPAAGRIVIIRRETDRDRLVQFVDGSVLLANDLNVAQLQAIHIAAEALDAASGSLLIDQTGAYTAGFRRITQVGTPTQPSDAVNKEWAETSQTATLAQTISAKTAAETARDAAAASASTANTRASTATTKATEASTSATTASTKAGEAATSATTATTKAGEAAASATTATTQAGIATTKAAEAAASATQAATFNPALYIQKVGDTLTGGYTAADDPEGTVSSGTVQLSPVGGNYKTLSNAGAFTLAAPVASGSYTIVVDLVNVTGAGAVTLSGFNRVLGDTITAIVGSKFQIAVQKTLSGVVASVVALQ